MTTCLPLSVLEIRLSFPSGKQVSVSKVLIRLKISKGFVHVEEVEFQQLFPDLSNHGVSFPVYSWSLNPHTTLKWMSNHVILAVVFMQLVVSLKYPESCSIFSPFAIHPEERFS